MGTGGFEMIIDVGYQMPDDDRKILDITWICGRTNVGLITTINVIDGQVATYCKSVPGADLNCDIIDILQYGSKIPIESLKRIVSEHKRKI